MKRKILIMSTIIVLLAASFIPTAARAATTNIVYTVQPGDSLSSIAYRYCTTWQAIYNMNSAVIGPDPNALEPGMVLTIPANCSGGGTATPPPPPPPSGSTCSTYDSGPRSYATGSYLNPYYTVAWGDTLNGISQRFGVSAQSIMSANGLPNETIYAGQVLYIPQCGTSSTPPPSSSGSVIRVQFAPGTSSASMVGTIYNGAPSTYVLTILAGQKLIVSGQSHGEGLTVSVKNTQGQTIPVSGANSTVNFNVTAFLSYTDDYFVTFTPVTKPESPTLAFDVIFNVPPLP